MKNDVQALRKAVSEGDLEKVKLLVKESPDLVFAKDNNGATPLHWAAEKGDTPAAEILLTNHALPTARDSDGWTASDWAAACGHWQVERLLRQHTQPLGWGQPISANPFRFPSGDAFSVADLVRLSEGNRALAVTFLVSGDFERWLAYAGRQRFAVLATDARLLADVNDADRLASFLADCRQEQATSEALYTPNDAPRDSNMETGGKATS
jgi:hypothetical protein